MQVEGGGEMAGVALVFVVTLAAGLVQGVTGFGSAIIMMSILPFVMNLQDASAITNIVSVALTVRLLWDFRRDVAWRLVPLPCVCYFVGSYATLAIVRDMDVRLLKLAFGAFLIVIACYFVFFKAKVKLKTNVPTLVFCGLLAGACDGAFGAGSGPIFVLYFLSACSSTREYLGTVQACLLVGVTYLLVLKVAYGIVTPTLAVPGVAGVVGVLAGTVVAARTRDKIDDQLLRKLTYALIAVAGVTTVVGAL